MQKNNSQKNWKIYFKKERVKTMKKALLLTAIISIALSSQVFAGETGSKTPEKQVARVELQKMHKPPMAQHKADFGKRLNLTEEQKAQAKEIHQKGFEEIKPLMEKIKLKHEEIEAVKRSSLAPEAQAEKIVQLRKEVRELKRQTREIQMKNMKEFESILTDKQKNELKKMKEEGRKNFEKTHKKQMFKMPQKPGFGCPKKPGVGCPKKPPIGLPVEKPVPVEK